MPPTKSPMSISAISDRLWNFRTAASERGAGRAGDMVESRRPRNIDALVDAVDPGRAGIGDHDAGRAEDGDSADNAETRVERLQRQLFAVGYGNLDLVVSSGSGYCPAIALVIIRRGTGLIAGSPGRQRQAGPGDRADARTSLESHARSRRSRSDGRRHQRAMRHIGIVAGILHDSAPSLRPCRSFEWPGQRQVLYRPAA